MLFQVGFINASTVEILAEFGSFVMSLSKVIDSILSIYSKHTMHNTHSTWVVVNLQLWKWEYLLEPYDLYVISVMNGLGNRSYVIMIFCFLF